VEIYIKKIISTKDERSNGKGISIDLFPPGEGLNSPNPSDIDGTLALLDMLLDSGKIHFMRLYPRGNDL